LEHHRITPEECAREAKQYIEDTARLVIDTAAGGGAVHISQSFGGFPKRSAMVVCLVACPEAFALQVQEAIDQAVEKVLDGFPIFEPTVN
jgi:hypothetical protein